MATANALVCAPTHLRFRRGGSGQKVIEVTASKIPWELSEDNEMISEAFGRLLRNEQINQHGASHEKFHRRWMIVFHAGTERD
jgi:hypothetical protein